MTVLVNMPATHHPANAHTERGRAGRGTAPARGFTLVEVMVALIIISIGMLGIAKLQGLSLSSTAGSRTRALAAIEASSLAAAMQANRAYWSASGSLPGSIAVATAAAGATTVTSTSSTMQTSLNQAVGTLCPSVGTNAPSLSCYCVSTGAARCTTPVDLAGSDLYDWSQGLGSLLPNATATVTCNNAVLPVDCVITILWTENAVSLNAQEASAATSNGTTAVATFQQVSYVLAVVP
jgi:type IV pilus assembly protein PilV